jgi:pyruvate formate lyase activating enzyme
MVTNGYITKEARKEVFQYIDAANVDLKAFTETFYHNLTYSHLEDVLDTIKWLYNETDVWVELTNLIIPTHNDNKYEIIDMVDWILKSCSDKLPLHFTAFHPDFKMKDLPSTPQDTLNRAREIAMDMGMKYVYTGNVSDSKSQTTYCPQCKFSMIGRTWHSVISPWGPICNCGYKLEGVFK